MKSSSIQKGYTLKPLIELLVASAFWGLGFVATVFVLKDLDTGPLLFWRFLLAAIIGIPLHVLFDRNRRSLSHFLSRHWLELKWTFIPSVFLACTLLLQTWGLEDSTATEAGFITTLYIVFVPLISFILYQTSISAKHIAAVVFALIGTAMLVKLSWSGLRMSQILLLGNAVCAAGHILSLDTLQKRSPSPFLANAYQCFWCMLFFLPFMFISERVQLSELNLPSWLGLLSLSFGSSLLAFYLQLRAQKSLNPSTASLFFILESVFAAVFSYFLLNERFESVQIAGAGIILLTCVWMGFRLSNSPTNTPHSRHQSPR